MARKKAELVSKRVEKLFKAHGLIVRNFGDQLVVFEIRESGRTPLQVFRTVEEARTSLDIL